MKNLVAVFRDPNDLANAVSKLAKEQIRSETESDGGVEILKNGYPNAFQIHQLFVEKVDFQNAASLLDVETPLGAGVLCPKCNSYRIVWSQWFLAWSIPQFFVRGPDRPGRRRRCTDCGFAWRRYNRSSW
jgi:hypothetical protein